MNPLIESIYGKLDIASQEGSPTLDQFTSDLQSDENLRRAVYDKLGLSGQHSFEDFSIDIGPELSDSEQDTLPVKQQEEILNQSNPQEEGERGFLGSLANAFGRGIVRSATGAVRFAEAVGLDPSSRPTQIRTTERDDIETSIAAVEKVLERNPDNQQVKDRLDFLRKQLETASDEEIVIGGDSFDQSARVAEQSGDKVLQENFERPLSASFEGIDKILEEDAKKDVLSDERAVDLLKEGDIGGVFQKAGITFAESLPNLAVTIANAPVGLSLIGTSTFGSKFDDLKDKGVSDEKALTAASITGLAEVGSEAITAGIGKAAFNALVGKQAKKKAVTEILLSNPITAALAEGAGEGLTQVAENVADFYADQKGDKKLEEVIFENVDEAFLLGSIIGGGISTIGTVADKVVPKQEDNQDIVASGSESLPTDNGSAQESTDPATEASTEGEGETPSTLNIEETVKELQDISVDEGDINNIVVSSDGSVEVKKDGKVIHRDNLTESEKISFENAKEGNLSNKQFKSKILKRIVGNNTEATTLKTNDIIDGDGNLNGSRESLVKLQSGQEVILENDSKLPSNVLSNITGVSEDNIFTTKELKNTEEKIDGNRVTKDGVDYVKRDNRWYKIEDGEVSKRSTRTKKLISELDSLVSNPLENNTDKRFLKAKQYLDAQKQTPQEETQDVQGNTEIQEPETVVQQENAEIGTENKIENAEENKDQENQEESETEERTESEEEKFLDDLYIKDYKIQENTFEDFTDPREKVLQDSRNFEELIKNDDQSRPVIQSLRKYIRNNIEAVEKDIETRPLKDFKEKYKKELESGNRDVEGNPTQQTETLNKDRDNVEYVKNLLGKEIKRKDCK